MVDNAIDHDDIELNRRAAMKLFGGGVTVGVLAGCIGDDDTADDGVDDGDDDDFVPGEPGDPVEFDLMAPRYRTYDEEMRYVADQWEEHLGVTVNLEFRDWSTHLAEIYGGDYETGIGFTSSGTTPARVDPQGVFGHLISDAIPSPNRSRWANDEFDELFDQMVSEFDPDQRSDIIGEMQELVAEELPVLAHGWPPFISPTNTTLWDVEPARFLGFSSFHRLGQYEAEPLTDETTLVFALVGDIETGNPIGVTESGVLSLLQSVFDTPRIFDHDGSVRDWACDTEVVDDHTVALTLKDGVDEFTDGTEVTADDLAFSFNYMAEHRPPEYAPVIPAVEGAEVVDDRTAHVNLSHPDAAFMTSTLPYFPILPEHVFEDIPEGDEPIEGVTMEPEEIVGFGPFDVVEWSSDRLRLVQNEDYFQGPPGPDEIILVGRGSMDAIRTDMVAGEVHANHSIVPPGVAEEIEAGTDDVEIFADTSAHWEHLSWIVDVAPFDDLEFRRALTRSVNIQEYSDVFWLGDWLPGDNTPVNPAHDLGVDLPTIDELFDPEEARSILEDAGYTWEDDQLRYPE